MKYKEDFTLREINEAQNHVSQKAIDTAYKFYDFLNDTFGEVDGTWSLKFTTMHYIVDTYQDSIRKEYNVMLGRNKVTRLLLNSETLGTVAKPLPSIIDPNKKAVVF
jgi:hypothetical protein